MTDFFQPQLQPVLNLLAECALPTEDLSESNMANFLACGDRGRPAGVIGLELHHPFGLIRSLAVSPKARGSGHGKDLLAAIEDFAGKRELQAVYLLTTTAPKFFELFGYRQIPRLQAPQAITRTAEFASICPADAVVMSKDLSALIS